jgi:hypothetical protein
LGDGSNFNNYRGVWFMQSEVIKIRIATEIKNKFESIAESEQRTFAGQVRLALQEWINTRGASCAKTIRAKKELVGKLTKSV